MVELKKAISDICKGLCSRLCLLACIIVVLVVLLISNMSFDEYESVVDDKDDVVASGVVESVSLKENGDKVESTVIITDVSIIKEGELCKQTDVVNDYDWKNALTLDKKLQLFIDGQNEIKVGSRIIVSGKVRNYTKPRNPGEFDYFTYYHNIGYLFSITDVKILAKSSQFSLVKEALFTLKVKISKTFDIYFDEIDATILKGMLLGMKKDVNSQVKDTFSKNGIAHILAISGLHISFLCMGLYKILVRLNLPMMVCVIGSEIFLVLYILMVGFSPSAFRAGIMFSLYMTAVIIRRSYDLLNAMGISLIIISSFNYLYIFDSGCQLSYLAIIAVGVFYAQFVRNVCNTRKLFKIKDNGKRLIRIINMISDKLIGAIFVSLFVFLTTFPVLVCCYNEVAFYSVLLNIVVVPLMSVLLAAGVLTVLISFIWTNAGFVTAFICKAILWIYKYTCVNLENSGFGRRNIATPKVWIVVLYYLIFTAICLYRGRYRIKVFISGTVIMLLMITIRFDFVAKMYFLDVNQGDGIVLFNDNGNVYLFDGGSTGKKSIGEHTIIPFLKYKGVNEIEASFISHPDADHMNGIFEVLNNSVKECIKIKKIYVYDGFLECEEFKELSMAARNAGTEIIGISSGYRLIDGELVIGCIYPFEGTDCEDTNNASLVLEIDYGNISILETGDVESIGEQSMLDRNVLTDIDILKVSHHGSNSSTTEAFLKQINPKVAIISVGESNSYGHPHNEVLERLGGVGAGICRTDEKGCVKVVLKRDKYYIDEFIK